MPPTSKVIMIAKISGLEPVAGFNSSQYQVVME